MKPAEPDNYQPQTASLDANSGEKQPNEPIIIVHPETRRLRALQSHSFGYELLDHLKNQPLLIGGVLLIVASLLLILFQIQLFGAITQFPLLLMGLGCVLFLLDFIRDGRYQ